MSIWRRSGDSHRAPKSVGVQLRAAAVQLSGPALASAQRTIPLHWPQPNSLRHRPERAQAWPGLAIEYGCPIDLASVRAWPPFLSVCSRQNLTKSCRLRQLPALSLHKAGPATLQGCLSFDTFVDACSRCRRLQLRQRAARSQAGRRSSARRGRHLQQVRAPAKTPKQTLCAVVHVRLCVSSRQRQRSKCVPPAGTCRQTPRWRGSYG